MGQDLGAKKQCQMSRFTTVRKGAGKGGGENARTQDWRNGEISGKGRPGR